jgi:hypothetical protein
MIFRSRNLPVTHNLVPILAAAPGGAAAQPSPFVVMILVVLVVGVGVILVVSTRAKIERRNAERGTPREQIERIRARALDGTDPEVATAELLATAQRLAAQLDNKAERLDLLIREADERLAALEEAARWAPDGAGRIHGDRAQAEEDALDPLAAAVHRLADEGRSPVEIARELDEQVGKVELVLALRRQRRAG